MAPSRIREPEDASGSLRCEGNSTPGDSSRRMRPVKDECLCIPAALFTSSVTLRLVTAYVALPLFGDVGYHDDEGEVENHGDCETPGHDNNPAAVADDGA